MYTLMILFTMIIFPIPAIMKYMLTGRNAYRGIIEGALSAIFGVVIIFLIFWTATGVTFYNLLDTAFKQISLNDLDFSIYNKMGMEKLDAESMQEAFDQVKQIIMLSVPGWIIITSMIFAYIDSVVISWIVGRGAKKISKLPPLRSLSLPKDVILGSFIIYFLSYIVADLGIIDKELIMNNLQILFIFIFSIQGFAVLLYIGHLKRIPGFVVAILTAITALTWQGQAILLLLGVSDIMLDIRKRISQTNLKT